MKDSELVSSIKIQIATLKPDNTMRKYIYTSWLREVILLERQKAENDKINQALSMRIKQLNKDAARLDWLADKNNTIGNVQLPEHCVMANLHSLRDAIDMAMNAAGEDHGNPNAN